MTVYVRFKEKHCHGEDGITVLRFAVSRRDTEQIKVQVGGKTERPNGGLWVLVWFALTKSK